MSGLTSCSVVVAGIVGMLTCEGVCSCNFSVCSEVTGAIFD